MLKPCDDLRKAIEEYKRVKQLEKIAQALKKKPS
jgi:hypothetical protein